jgi:hypothetical protein
MRVPGKWNLPARDRKIRARRHAKKKRQDISFAEALN